MQTYDLTFTGAGTVEMNVPGKYFALLACNNAVTVRFFLGGKRLDLGEISNVLSGLECTLGDIGDIAPAFDRVQIQTAGADTVTIGIGNGQSRYNRGGQSSVTITNVNGPFSQAVATVTTAAAALAAAAPTRRYLLVQNKDAAGSIWLNFGGAAATQANGIKIPPGGAYECQGFAPTGSISALGDIASNANIIVVQG